MLVRIYDGNENVVGEKKGIPAPKRDSDLLKLLDEVLAEQAPSAFGGEYEGFSEDTQIFSNKGYHSTFIVEKGSQVDGYKRTGFGYSFALTGPVAEEEIRKMSSIVLMTCEGKKIIPFGVNFFDEGYVIATNTTGTNFVGTSGQKYIVRTSMSNGCTTAFRSGAKLFPTAAALLKHFEKYKELYAYMVKTYGYNLSIEAASAEAEREMIAEMNERQLKSHHQKMKMAQEIIDAVNGTPIKETNPEDYNPGDITPEEEAFIRMTEMGIMPDIRNLFARHGTVMISDVGGIFFSLDEEARKLVKMVREDFGGVPYMIVRYGSMYSALYVSKHREEWGYEHYDKRSKAMRTITTNTKFPCCDVGDIWVDVTNAGGLSRIA